MRRTIGSTPIGKSVGAGPGRLRRRRREPRPGAERSGIRSVLARPPEQLLRLAGTLADGFYLLAFVALVAALTGAPGLGLLFLFVAGALHAARIGIEETVRDDAEPDAAEPEIKVFATAPRRATRPRSRRTVGTRR
jgi:hypothetical protein